MNRSTKLFKAAARERSNASKYRTYAANNARRSHDSISRSGLSWYAAHTARQAGYCLEMAKYFERSAKRSLEYAIEAADSELSD